MCGISNALNGSEDDAIYDNEMPEVADDDMEDEFETDFKQNGSFRSHHLNRSHWPTMIYMHVPFVSSQTCLLINAQLIVE